METDKQVYIPFCLAVEIASKSNFSPENYEVIKKYITQKGANPNWPIGTDKNTLLGLSVKFANKDLFNFLIQNNANINATNMYGQTPLHFLAMKHDDNKKFNISVKDLVDNGANINAKTLGKLTPLHTAVYSDNIYCLQELVKFGANINKQCKQMTPLEIAIDPIRHDVEMLKELCKLKSSLTNPTTKSNIFHGIINASSKKHLPLTIKGDITIIGDASMHSIKTIMTHARFDGFEKGSKKTVLYGLFLLKCWEFKNNRKLPKDIKLHILAQLDLYDLYPYKNLCKELLQKNYNYILLPQLYKCVENIKQILASPNNENKTALQLMLEKCANHPKYIEAASSLLNGELLQNNYDDFIARFPDIVNSQKKEDKKNLVRQMFDNCVELLSE